MTTSRRSEPDQQTPFFQIAPYYDQLMASVPYRFWVSYIEALWKSHGCRPRRVLDLACGTGTVALTLGAKGYEMVGIDISGPMIEVAKDKARAKSLNIDFRVADAAAMPDICPPVGCTLSLFDSLNNILDPTAFESALRGVRRNLIDGGLFIFDLNTAYAFRKGMFNQRSSPNDAPLKYVWRSKFDEPSHLCTVTMQFEIEATLKHPASKFTEVHVQRAYSRVEVDEMLVSAGFSEITTYDAYTLFKPKKRSDRIFWVAR